MDNRKISNKNNKMIKILIKIYNKMKLWIALTMIKISWLKKEKYRKEIQIIMEWYKHRLRVMELKLKMVIVDYKCVRVDMQIKQMNK